MDWQKKDWFKGQNTPAAHPNSRFTVAASQSPVIAPEWENPEGVPNISHISWRKKTKYDSIST